MILKGGRDAEAPRTPGKMRPSNRIPITELNQHITCTLCNGYYIDATTIIECLHTFCRSCIVKYLETNKYCPVCDVQVHKSKPLVNIRPDKTLQDVVYKLVPRLFQNEMRRRRDFYIAHPQAKPSGLEQRGEASYQHLLSPEETICLSLNYHESTGPPRYLRCPAAVSIAHLQKLIGAKYDLSDRHRVDILHNQDTLHAYLTLMDVAYIYLWRRKGPLELTYRLFENRTKRLKTEEKLHESESDQHQNVDTVNNNNWKEVQLRISENGEISVTDVVQDLDVDTKRTVSENEAEVNCAAVCATSEGVDNKVEVSAFKNEVMTKAENLKLDKITTVTSTIESKTDTVVTTSIQPVAIVNSCSIPITSTITLEKLPPLTMKAILPTNTKTVTATSTMSAVTLSTSSNSKPPEKAIKHKSEGKDLGEPPAKQPKQTILNHTLGLHKLSNNHPLKTHSQMNELVPYSKPPVETTEPPIIINKTLNAAHKWKSSTPGPPPCYMPKTTYSPIINVPKLQPIVSKANEQKHQQHNNVKVPEQKPSNTKAVIKSKPSTPIGYKTLRDPPKTWNPQISRANLNRNSSSDGKSDLKNVRPPKFFKLRNNMPRYLGNPASGVKPMYQVHLSPEKEKAESKSDKSEIKKHSIVKIDPKTLKPISERAPETSNLSRTTTTAPCETDLKINTSSVPIFNPLKLQSSPKSERKSPKSPHSPKNKSASPPNRREKLNLNFTPANPFIPNLTSPTVSPNQFLFTSGPPGFPPYDPRVMAAYHTFLYGQQRMAFNASSIPGLSLPDLNQRNSYTDMAPPTSPKVTQAASSVNNASTSKGVKKNKDNNKNEKSLQNAVEKLTQNKIKEATNKLSNNEKEDSKSMVIDKGDRKEEVVKVDRKIDVKEVEEGARVASEERKPPDEKIETKPTEANENRTTSTEDKTKENSDTNNVKEKGDSKEENADKSGKGPCVNNNTESGSISEKDK